MESFLPGYRFRGICCVATLWGSAATCAHAQEAERTSVSLFRQDVAGSRIEPGSVVPPINLLGISVRAAARVEFHGDTNVLRSARKAEGDFSFISAGSLDLHYDGGQSVIRVHALGGTQRFVGLTRQDADFYNLGVGAETIASAAEHTSVALDYSRQTDARGFGGINIENASPVFYRLLQAVSETGRPVGPTAFTGSISVAERHYEDLRVAGISGLDQSFRDTRAATAAMRFALPVRPAITVFAGATSDLLFSTNAPIPANRRDSIGYSVLAGAHFDGDDVIVAEIAVGGRGRSYSSKRFQSYGGFTYDLKVDWYPTGFVSTRLEAAQTVENSGIRDVATIRRATQRINVYYDPLPQLRAAFRIEQTNDDFPEIDTKTQSRAFSVEAKYAVSTRLSLNLSLQYQNKTSSNVEKIGNFRGASFGLSLTGQL